MWSPLTADEVASLPEGTHVIVTWSGGNGPHKYVVHHHGGRAYALTTREYGEVEERDRHSTWDAQLDSIFGYVGVETFQTRVWLANGSPPSTCST